MADLGELQRVLEEKRSELRLANEELNNAQHRHSMCRDEVREAEMKMLEAVKALFPHAQPLEEQFVTQPVVDALSPQDLGVEVPMSDEERRRARARAFRRGP